MAFLEFNPKIWDNFLFVVILFLIANFKSSRLFLTKPEGYLEPIRTAMGYNPTKKRTPWQAGRAGLYSSHELLIIMVVLLLLFGSGGFYLGEPVGGGDSA
jgi:hypothetical protein